MDDSERTRGKSLENRTCSLKITDLCKSIKYSHTPFEALIPDREEWEQGRPGTTDAICFYTDGSKLEGHVGGGEYSKELDIRKSFRLPDHCSVYLQAKHKKLLQLAKRTTVSYLSPDMACD